MAFIGDFPIQSRIAVVTGAGSGINLAFAKLCVKRGAQVIIADLKLTPDAESYLRGEGAKAAIFVKGDVTKRAKLENLIKASEEKFADVPDVYIAGAGVFEPVYDTEDDGYAAVDINVTHPIKFARIALRALLRKNKKGVFLIVSSIAGFQGSFSSPLYAATKHAVTGFVRSMAELDRLEGVKVVACAPGVVATPLWTEAPEKLEQYSYKPEYALTPERVAEDMLELVVDGKYPGGTCLESSLGGTRTMGTWNIPEPEGYGTAIPTEFLEKNYKPMIEMMKKERGQSKL
ncbi:hypothetical protein HYALB_00003517 [Hymenoscyphus albidus]|uniref:NAD(P)-binding protein n=1 Tax=Hymenoscyphus albidus TaxID=595503 RepID=A0A9N9Q7M9_9HELO|nr:hypothetical protein HYALB_00003517 [Hymenoscyphus albidus]